jgi:hypothetical protein
MKTFMYSHGMFIYLLYILTVSCGVLPWVPLLSVLADVCDDGHAVSLINPLRRDLNLVYSVLVYRPMICKHFLSPGNYSCWFVHLIFLGLNTRMMLGGDSKFCTSLYCSCLHPPVTSSSLGPNIKYSVLHLFLHLLLYFFFVSAFYFLL